MTSCPDGSRVAAPTPTTPPAWGHSGVRSKILLVHLVKDLQHVTPAFVTRPHNSLIICNISPSVNHFSSNHSPMNHGNTASEHQGSPLTYLRGCHTWHLPKSTFDAKTSWLNNLLYSQSHNICRQSLDMRLRSLSSRIRIERGVTNSTVSRTFDRAITVNPAPLRQRRYEHTNTDLRSTHSSQSLPSPTYEQLTPPGVTWAHPPSFH